MLELIYELVNEVFILYNFLGICLIQYLVR